MPAPTPLRRAPELQPLSRDHHTALLVAHRLLRGIEGRAFAGPPASLDGLVREALAFDRDHFRDHAMAEERFLVPRLRAAAGLDPISVDRLIAEHFALRRHLEAAADVTRNQDERRAALAGYATCLEAHVRFEERELFPAAERAIGATELAALGTDLAAYEAEHAANCRVR